MNQDTPISERVKFWQEQDRINKALIPRVVKMHDTLTRLVGKDAQISERLSATEARFASEQRSRFDTFRQDMEEGYRTRCDAIGEEYRVQLLTATKALSRQLKSQNTRLTAMVSLSILSAGIAVTLTLIR